jgi:hypothetical protein
MLGVSLARRVPEERAEAGQESVRRIRRRYKVALNKPKVYVLGEKEHVADMVVVLKLAGYSNTQIGRVVGISRGQVKDLLAEPQVAERLQELRTALPRAALDLLHGYTIEAVQAIVDVLRSSEDDALILRAAAEILDRAGIGKTSRTESSVHQTKEHKTTITADEDVLKSLRELPAEKQEEAAQMMENLENFLKESTMKEEK